MRKRSSLMRRMVVAVVGCSLLVFVLRSGEWQTTMASYVAYPFIMARQWVSENRKRRADNRISRELLVARLHAIIAERDMLLRQLIERESVIRYETDSCEVREFKKRYHLERGHIAQVLMVNRTPAGHFMLVSSGATSGVEPDMVVLAQNSLIGRVSAVYPYYSRVQLITDKNCRVAAVCTRTGARGIHEGANNEQVTHLSFVSHFDTVEVGDMVVSQGSGLIFPRGFALGKIRSAVPSGVFYAIDIEPLIDIKTVNFCLIVRRQDVDVVVCPPATQSATLVDQQQVLPATKPLPLSAVCPDRVLPASQPADQPVQAQEPVVDQPEREPDDLARPDAPVDQEQPALDGDAR